MSTVLQTTIGQLEVARGQRRDHAPNVRAVEPGEAKGNLYLLLELTGPQDGRSRLYRQVLSEVQSTYYNTSGNVDDILHTAVSQGHRLLSEANAGRSGDQRWRGGMSCVALWQDHVYLAQAGPATVMVTHPATVEMFPVYAEPPQDALGDDNAPMIDLYHTRIEPGNVILLLESDWATQAGLEALASAATAPRLTTITDYLVQLAEDAHLTALIVMVKESASTAAPSPGRTQPTTAGPAASSKAAATTERPLVIPLVTDDEESSNADWADEDAWWEDAELAAPTVTAPPTAAPRQPSRTDARQPGGSNLIEAGRTLIKRVLPDTPGKSGATRPPTGAMAPAPKTSAAPAAAARPPRPRPPAQPASRSRLPLILAIAIPIIILTIVAVMYVLRARDREQRFQSLLDEAQTTIAAVASLDETQARAQLTTAQTKITDALALKPGNLEAQDVQGRVRAELDRVNRVVPLYLVAPLKEFEGTGRELARVLVDGADIFILDRGRDTVERYRLNQQGDGLQPNDGGPLVTRGQSVGSLVVGELIDMVWAPPVGPRTDSTLLVLDATGMLYEFRAPWELKARPVAMRDMWKGPRLTASYAGNFYVLDSTLQQVLKYRPGADLAYDSAPEQYFPPTTPIDLTGAVDMGIDGNVWILLANGSVQKFRSGQAEPFSLQGLPDPLQEPVGLFVGIDGGVEVSNLYVGAAGNGGIFQFDKNGVYTRQFREADGQKLRGLRSLFVDEPGARFFLLTSTALYRADIPR